MRNKIDGNNYDDQMRFFILQIILSDDDEKHRRNFHAVSISGKVRTDGRTRKVSSWNFDRDSVKKLNKGFFSSRVTVLKQKKKTHRFIGLHPYMVGSQQYKNPNLFFNAIKINATGNSCRKNTFARKKKEEKMI